MSLSARLAGAIAAAAAAALLLLPGAAYARAGDLSFQQTYPKASTLCADIAAGKGHPKLAPSAPQVLTDCALLQNEFNVATADVLATRASLDAVRTSLRTAALTTCAHREHSRACHRARRRQHRFAHVLLRERIGAAHLYFTRVELARRTFWTSIRMLRGGDLESQDPVIPLQDS
jgi:hypothetical protein